MHSRLTQGKVDIIPTDMMICKLRHRVSMKFVLLKIDRTAKLHNLLCTQF